MGIKKDKRNYRKHSEVNQEMIKKSLLENGAGRSILLDNEDEIIAGNETFSQAEKLGIPIQIIETDGKTLIAIKRTDLATKDDARKQLAIIDNLASDRSEFDFELLNEDFEINFLEDIGFESFELGFESEVEETIDLSDNITSAYEIVVECKDEAEQEKLFNDLKEKGYTCRVLTL